jgi:hypothetical protein
VDLRWRLLGLTPEGDRVGKEINVENMSTTFTQNPKGRYQQYLEDFQAEFRARLLAALPTADLTFDRASATITVPGLGTKILVGENGRSFMPVNSMKVRLENSIQGYYGEKVLRSRGKNVQVDLNRVVNQVVGLYQEVAPYYRRLREVKAALFPLVGLDPDRLDKCNQERGYSDNTRGVTFLGRDLTVWVEISTVYPQSGDAVVGVKFGVRDTKGLGRYRPDEIKWAFGPDDPIDVPVLGARLREWVEELNQSEQTSRDLEAKRKSNEEVASQIRKQYRDLDGVTLEANPETFRVLMFLKTEQEVRDLIEWLRLRRGTTTGNEGKCFHCEREVPLSSGLVLDDGHFFCCGDCALPYRV